MAPLISTGGWGVVASTLIVGTVPDAITGQSAGLPNVGLAINITTGTQTQRLTKFLAKLVWSVRDPTQDAIQNLWRLCVTQGQMPGDISAFQANAALSPAFDDPGLVVPKAIGQSAPQRILWDEWIDLDSGGGSGTVERDFADAGPAVGANDYMNIFLVPQTILDPRHPAVAFNPAIYTLMLSAFGTADAVGALGSGSSGGGSQKSLPRFASGF